MVDRVKWSASGIIWWCGGSIGSGDYSPTLLQTFQDLESDGMGFRSLTE